jgi:hypothetical protein
MKVCTLPSPTIGDQQNTELSSPAVVHSSNHLDDANILAVPTLPESGDYARSGIVSAEGLALFHGWEWHLPGESSSDSHRLRDRQSLSEGCAG